ncbi:MAG: PhnD/SsuA/transferrin family substrate-binding protein [Nitratireductor sp.]
MGLFAALQMYDLPELSPSWDRLWNGVHAALLAKGIRCEPELRRPLDYHEPWSDASLILGQTCGWPYVSEVGRSNTLLGVFDFGLNTPVAGDYHSVFVVSPKLADRTPAQLLADPGVRIAVNSLHSQSGYRVLGELASAPVKLHRKRYIDSGGHRSSLRMVASGEAHLAAIDAVTWEFLKRHDPHVTRVSILGRSRHAPGLPLICSNENARHGETVREAVAKAISQLEKADRDALMLKGLAPASASRYQQLLLQPFGNLAFAPA